MPNKAIIVEPFWGHSQRVSTLRIARFVRWLSAKGVFIILVRAGDNDRMKTEPWGLEVTIRDPLRIYGDVVEGSYQFSVRRSNPLRRWLAIRLLSPDTGIVWAKRAAYHPLVIEHAQNAQWVISSGPRESTHVTTSALARRTGASLIIDMRDGWLDEPIKPLLQTSRLQQWREGRLERAILLQAKHIFVTSDIWKELLEQRLPFACGKTTVLTNAYPDKPFEPKEVDTPTADGQICVLHAGRFTGSAPNRSVSCLLNPLLDNIQLVKARGKIILIGALEAQDLAEIESYKSQFEPLQWSVEAYPAVPRAEVQQQIQRADGLLLLSAARPPIPAKLFEYVPTKKPILAMTLEDSSVWRLAKSIPQLYVADYTQPSSRPAIQNFFTACLTKRYACQVPADFTEERLTPIFLQALGIAP